MTSSTSEKNMDETSTDLAITIVDTNTNTTQKGDLLQSSQLPKSPIILDGISPLSQELADKRLETYGKNVISSYKSLLW